MSATNMIIVVVAILAVIAVIGLRSRPRVTQITRTVHKEKDSDDA